MSESEYKKLRRQLRFLTVAVFVGIILGIASLIHKSINPKTTSFPQVQVVNGRNGISPRIDYSAIYEYIQSQIATLPKPQNGVNGLNGQSIVGAQGVPGSSMQGPPGPVGPQGEPGVPGRQIELRYNIVKQETEWRYTGDLGWQVLVQNCQVLETC